MQVSRAGFVMALALSVAACRPALVVGAFGDPAFVAGPRVTAAPAQLQGCWIGTYVAPFFARHGNVVAVFTPGGATASEGGPVGWLTLTTAPAQRGRRPSPPTATSACATPDSAIADRAGTVRVPLLAIVDRGGELSVRSEAYWDSDCGCTLVLTLTARQLGDTLVGVFSARAAATVVPESRGRWRVVRSRSPAEPARGPLGRVEAEGVHIARSEHHRPADASLTSSAVAPTSGKSPKLPSTSGAANRVHPAGAAPR